MHSLHNSRLTDGPDRRVHESFPSLLMHAQPHHNTQRTSPTDTKGPCWTFSRFGGWVPVKLGDNVKSNVHGWYLHVRQVIATPVNGCAQWVLQMPARTAPLVWECYGWRCWGRRQCDEAV